MIWQFYFNIIQVVMDENKIKKEKTKKDSKYKRKLKEEEKIYITDQENEAEPDFEPDIEAQIHIPEPTRATAPLRHSRNLSPWAFNRKPHSKTPYTHRHLAPQNDSSDDSSDSEDNDPVKYPVQYKTLGNPRGTISESLSSDSDTDVPRITRKRVSLRRIESSTEDELRSRAKIFQRFRNRQLSDSD